MIRRAANEVKNIPIMYKQKEKNEIKGNKGAAASFGKTKKND